jgi:two-component system NarL family sensor kinase
MTLTAAGQYLSKGDAASAGALLGEARTVVERNIQALRDEMLELGPYAFEELSYEAAVERMAPVWKRRFGVEAELSLERIDLPSDIEGELFRITQEAVTNAGKHGQARTVRISLARRNGDLELVVLDDGEGLRGVDPLGSTDPGHIGVASMRERTELLGGRLTIASTPAGTTVRVQTPLPGADAAV